MIYSLKGTLLCIEDSYIVVECGGVGYKCLTSAYTQEAFKSNLNTTILVYTYMNVRQDAIDLFGFSEKDELYNNAKRIKPIDGYEDIVIHADKHNFYSYNMQGDEFLFTAEEMAEILRRSKGYHGGI